MSRVARQNPVPSAAAQLGERDPPLPDDQAGLSSPSANKGGIVTPRGKEVRRRSKAHRLFVAAQPCLVCQRTPCDAHHLKFAQTNALGRKVSDEFTVPLCRHHHQDLHRRGNERSWWGNVKIDAVEMARQLWETSPAHGPSSPAAAYAMSTATDSARRTDS